MTTRRDFIRQATLLGAGLSMSPFFINATPGSVGANDKIRVGLIGCKGMGFSDLQAFLRNPEVECIALCDIDDEVLNSRAAETQKITGKKVKNLYKRLAETDRQQRYRRCHRWYARPLALLANGSCLPGR